jgi:ribosome-binding protein aMBF1 (putative translation factor)
MTAQIVEISGQKMALLPMADYERLIEIAEDQADISGAIAAQKRLQDGEELIPSELVYAIMDGENPLRAWRKYRGLTIEALAAMTTIRQSMLSMLENGKAQGKPAHWRALAEALNVAIEDIIPES